VALLLVLASANVANMVLVRLLSREGELSLRAMLGASRLRIVRQLWIEGLLLVGASGLLGLGIAAVGLDALGSLLPADLPRRETIDVDWRTAVFVAGVVMVVTMFLATVFAGRSTRYRPAGARAGVGDTSRSRIRGALVSVQVAAATVLLIGAALLGRSLFALLSVDPGFSSDRGFSVRISLDDETSPDAQDPLAFFTRVVRDLRELPGVNAVELASAVPLGGSWRTTGIHAELERADEITSGFVAVTGGYFEAIGIPLRAGRSFGERDIDGAEQVAVIDETLATALWPQDPAVGKRLSRSGPDGPWMVVVGVVGAVKPRSLAGPPPPVLYSAYAQRGWDSMDVVVVPGGGTDDAIARVRSRLGVLAPLQPLDDVRTLDDLVAASTSLMRLQSLLFGLFAAVAVAVAMLGVHALVANAVHRRRAEIGLRVALGATPRAVTLLVLLAGGWQVGVGLIAGVLIAIATRGLLASMVFGVAPGDPLTFVGVPVALAAIAAVAIYIPARSASRVNPVEALAAPE
jgi:predicted permease